MVFRVLVFMELFLQYFNVVLFCLTEDGAWRVKRSVLLNLISILEVDELAIWAGLMRASTPVTLFSSALICLSVCRCCIRDLEAYSLLGGGVPIPDHRLSRSLDSVPLFSLI